MCGPPPACGERSWGSGMIRECTPEQWIAQGTIPPDWVMPIVLIITIANCIGLCYFIWFWYYNNYIDGWL